jgi:hypothetical protein
MARLATTVLIPTTMLAAALGVVVTMPTLVAPIAIEPALEVHREPPTLASHEHAREPAPAPAANPVLPTSRTVALPPPPGFAIADGDDEDDLPDPPADPSHYQAWRMHLPKQMQHAIARHCRRNGGTFFPVCNGIGPLAIPMPPPLEMPLPPGATSTASGPTRDEWYASLTQPQQRYYDRYCDGDEGRAFTDLCGATPLVVAFANERIAFTPAATRFRTDWPTATTPWLALDRDGDGAITSSAELFGGDTVLADGSRPAHGFVALAELDGNSDGRLDAADPMFAALLLWADHDGDRASSSGELAPAARTLVSISLAYTSEARCAGGNCERERASITWRDAAGELQTGTLVDVYLAHR